jgi:hypothetical protein
MRTLTLQRLGANLLPANVTMIGLAPVYMVQFLRTFTGGHSRAVLDAIAQQDRARQMAEKNEQTVLAALRAVHACLDRADRAAAVQELDAAYRRMTQTGQWEIALYSYLRAIERGQLAGARDAIPRLPAALQMPLTEVLDKFAERLT